MGEMKNIANVLIHESSYVDAPMKIGAGTKIWHFCHVMPGAQIGKDCVLGQNVNVGSKAILGNNVRVQNNVSIYDAVELHDDVFCGPSMVFTNVINPRSTVNRKEEYQVTVVHKGASIGANATIVCGCTIGRYAFIGAGTVVTRDVPDFAQVVGVPGKINGYRCMCGEALTSNAVAAVKDCSHVCGSCQRRYQKANEGLVLCQ